ncbi:hypothetical protein SAMN04487907_1211 [Zunongwangia mangrovi]|uniref:Lipoprotein n=1 Tax=Zunongwangia mangrovi TaxID=1334022 RepID=A0A1I1NL95_9FLAO|nr:hypothetical protein SAMN04487907_1211 [Zunongwangia mangrovi]
MKNFLNIIIFLILLVACENKASDKEEYNVENIEKTQIKKHIENNELTKSTEPLDTLINTHRFLAIGNVNAEIKIINQSDSLKYKDFKVVDFKDQILVVAKNLDENRFEIYERYNPNFTFEDFKVPVYNGTLVEPDFESYPWAKRFITRITDGCKNGINFAGKYTLIIWGCGSPCQGGAIVDRTNGKIYNGYFSTYGSEFRIDSKLIIFNPTLIDEETKLMSLHHIAKVRTEIWNGSEFIAL